MSTSRREFLRRGTLLFGGAMVMVQEPQQQGAAKGADPLPDPESIGQTRDALHPLDNDPVVVAIEHKLHCTCGCTLDIYTCRTTDFTCTFSPALHREIRGMVEAGKTPEQIIDSLVAREGPKMLMAPPAEGFNLAGYLVPGLSVLSAALVLAAWLTRRRKPAAVAARASAMVVAPLDAEQAARLKRALDDVEA